MIPRFISNQLEQLSARYPIVAVTGPRQSGKTTLVRDTFPPKKYASLEKLLPLEIKSGQTITQDFFKGLKYWSKISKTTGKDACLIYGGEMDQIRKDGTVMGWKSFARQMPLMI